MAVKYNYKYKPTAASYFTNKSLGEREKLTKSLTSQTENLEKRLEQQGVSTQGNGEIDQRNLIEKALNLGADQVVLMDVLEVIDRPRQVVANVLSSIGNEDDRNVLEAAWEGLSGKKKLTSKEAIQKLVGDDDFLEFEDQGAGLDWADVGNFVVDLGLDMATDPTTYLGWKWLTGPIKQGTINSTKFASKLARASRIYGTGVVKMAGDAVGAIETVARKASYVFDAFKGFDEKTIEAIKKINARAGRMAEQLRSGVAFVRGKLASTGVPDAEKIMSEIVENGGEFITENGQKVLKYGKRRIILSDTLDMMLKNLKEKGVGAHIIPQFGTNAAVAQQQLDDILTELNRLLPSTGGTQSFVQRLAQDGSRSIEFKGTLDELKMLIGNLKATSNDPASLLKRVIDLGEGIPSEKAIEFASKYGDIAEDSLKRIRRIKEGSRKLISSFGEYDVADDISESGTEYMRHIQSDYAKETMDAARPGIDVKYKSPGTDQFQGRSFEGTAAEVNKAMKSIYGAEGDIFNESAIDSLTDLVKQAEKKYTQQETTRMLLGVKLDPSGRWVRDPNAATNIFLDVKDISKGYLKANLPDGYKVIPSSTHFKETFSNLFKNLPDEMKGAFDDILGAAGLGAGEGIAINRSAYNVLKNLDNAYREINPLIKSYDKFMGMWKGVNLLSPGFHLRNWIGNSTNMFLAGMNATDIIKYQGKATTAMFRYRQLEKLVQAGAKLSDADKVFMTNVSKFLNSGASQIVKGGTRDLAEVAELVSTKTTSKLKGAVAKVVDTNFKWAEHADEAQRYAMWLWSMDKTGGNTLKSLQTVRNALFDYSNLTPFERDYMKRIVPFYTFMKNNFVFQASNLLDNTKQYSKLLRTYDKWNDNIGDIKTEDMPDYMSGNMWLPMPMVIDSNDEDTISFLKLNLPPADFFEFIENPLKKGVTSITVPIKLAWELGTGTDAFTGAPLEAFPGQKLRIEEGTGVLPGIRGEKGEFRLSDNPVLQKLSDELGARNPRKVATALLDIFDTAAGTQSPEALLKDLMGSLGLSETKDVGEIKLTQLYQYLEYLRNMKKLYEQETGGKLPGKARSTNPYAKLK